MSPGRVAIADITFEAGDTRRITWLCRIGQSIENVNLDSVGDINTTRCRNMIGRCEGEWNTTHQKTLTHNMCLDIIPSKRISNLPLVSGGVRSANIAHSASQSPFGAKLAATYHVRATAGSDVGRMAKRHGADSVYVRCGRARVF